MDDSARQGGTTAGATLRSARRALRLFSAVALLVGLAAPAAAVTVARLEQLPQHWRDDRNQAASFNEMKGRRVVVTMAYANCHQICPMTIMRLKALQEAQDALGQTLEIVVVGLDPERDDPAAWHQYRLHHHLARPNWHFLAGSPRDTQLFATQLGFEFWKYDEHVMHDARVLLFDADGTLEGALDGDDLNAAIAHQSGQLP